MVSALFNLNLILFSLKKTQQIHQLQRFPALQDEVGLLQEPGGASGGDLMAAAREGPHAYTRARTHTPNLHVGADILVSHSEAPCIQIIIAKE